MRLELEAEIETSDVVRSIKYDPGMRADNYKGALEFVLEIDDAICDLQFTVALRDRLNEIIEAEEE